MCVTRCVMEELFRLGSATYGAVPICKQFEVKIFDIINKDL